MSVLSPTSGPACGIAAQQLARELLFRFLAGLFGDPRQRPWEMVLDPENQQLACDACDQLRAEFSDRELRLGFGEAPLEELHAADVVRALAQPAEVVQAEYVRVFGLISSRDVPCYETDYQRIEDTFFRSQQMADVAGFYRAFGVQVGASRERPDHIALELEFYSLLLLKERMAAVDPAHVDEVAAQYAATCREAREAFFREHLAWWTPAFAHVVRRQAESGLYEAAARLLAALVPVERTILGVEPQQGYVAPNAVEQTDPCEGCGLLSSA